MKLKENKGVSLTGFVITILVILLVVAIAGCIYLLNNTRKEKVTVQNLAPVSTLNSSSKVENKVEVKINEFDIDSMSKIFKILNFIQTLEFTNTNKITNEEINNLLIGYFSVNYIEDVSKYSKTEIRQLVKDVLNKDYSGSLNLEIEGEGEAPRDIAIQSIENKNNDYIIKYAVVVHIDSDAPDEIVGYYEARLDENLILISNKEIMKK